MSRGEHCIDQRISNKENIWSIVHVKGTYFITCFLYMYKAYTNQQKLIDIHTFSKNICLNVSRQRAWWSLLLAWLRNQFRQSSEHSLSRATQRHKVSTCSRFRPTAYNKEITATSYSVISFLMKILYHSRIFFTFNGH